MFPIQNLSILNSNEKWIVENSQIIRAPKQSGLKNVLDFVQVIKFAQGHIQGITQNEVIPYLDRLTTQYTHVKAAISRQNPITRIFLRLLLYFHGFESSYSSLVQTALALPLRTEVPFIPKGGFQNSGHSCFIASALHCFNHMYDAFSINIGRREGETDEQFSQRTTITNYIKQLLEKSNRHELVTAQEMSHLQEIWNAYDSSIPTPREQRGFNLASTFVKILELFEIPPFEFIYKGRSRFTQVISRLLNVDCDLLQPTDNICRLNFTLAFPEKSPLFLPIYVQMGNFPGRPGLRPQLKFANCEDVYELYLGAGMVGHSYCYAKHRDGQWIKYDDACPPTYHSTEKVYEEFRNLNDFFLIYRKV